MCNNAFVARYNGVERGVAATSLREVAREAGVAPGLVVHYFGGKDGLHQEVDGFVVDLFRAALDSVPWRAAPATSWLPAMVR